MRNNSKYKILVLIILFLSGLVFSQSTGKIKGVVLDETGSPLQGASVLVLGTEFKSEVDGDGYYYIIGVSPGIYTVQAELSGYAKKEVKDVRVRVSLPTTQNFILSYPDAAEEFVEKNNDEVNDTDYDALFFKVFGYKKTEPDQLLIPIYVDEKRIGKIELFRKDNNGGYHFIKKELVNAIGKYLDPEISENLFVELNGYDKIYTAKLKEKGFGAEFDEKSLIFKLTIPPEFRRKNSSDLGLTNAPESINYATRPNSFSSFLNIRASEDFRYDENNREDDIRKPVQLNFDGAVNIKNMVFEGIADYNERYQWQRGDLRLIYDRPDKMIRFYAGDIIYPIEGFQTFQPVGGAGFSKNFNLQPYFSTKPISNSEIMVVRHSVVEIFHNNMLVNKFEVEPGALNLREASIRNGVSNVSVKITDSFGEEKVIDLDNYYNNGQLDIGLSQYSYNFGFESDRSGRTYEYDKKKPVASLFYKAGINKYWTAGINSQLKKDQYLIGSSNSFGTKYGNYDLDYAVSTTDFSELDYALRTSYHYFNSDLNTNPYQRQWMATFEYKSEYFGINKSIQTESISNYLLTGSVNQNIGKKLSASVSGSYKAFGGEFRNSFLYSVYLNLRVLRSLKLTCRTTYNNLNAEDEWKSSITLSYFPDSRNYFNSGYNSHENSTTSTWNHNSPNHNLSNSFSVNKSKSTPMNFSDRITYSGNRGIISVENNYEKNRINNITNSTRLNVAYGIVFVDGKLGLSKPVGNSFALIKPNKTLQKYSLGINKNSNGSYEYNSGTLGPVVYSSLNPYTVKEISIHTPDIPIGYKITGSDQVLLPSYKSGFLIEVKGEEFIFVKGKLLDDKGMPLIKKVAKIKAYGNSSMETKTVFTNNGGYFFINEIKPGNYELYFDENEFKSINFKINRTGGASYYELGTLELKK